MIIAIPIFGTRISPRFDCAVNLLIVTTRDDEISSREENSMEQLPWCKRIEILVQKEVDTVLCGGIRRCDFFLLTNAGMNVYAGLTGEVDSILHSFLAGEIIGDGLDKASVFRRQDWSGRGRDQKGPRRRGRGKRNEPRR